MSNQTELTIVITGNSKTQLSYFQIYGESYSQNPFENLDLLTFFLVAALLFPRYSLWIIPLTEIERKSESTMPSTPFLPKKKNFLPFPNFVFVTILFYARPHAERRVGCTLLFRYNTWLGEQRLSLTMLREIYFDATNVYFSTHSLYLCRSCLSYAVDDLFRHRWALCVRMRDRKIYSNNTSIIRNLFLTKS